jgi:c-di-GMP-binding flagellar brake protein YcgR
MEQQPTERRIEARFPIEAKVLVRRNTGETVTAQATNLSGAGMSLCLGEPSGLSLGEKVAVEVALPDQTDKPFASWGLGRVAWLDGATFGVELSAATFGPDLLAPQD